MTKNWNSSNIWTCDFMKTWTLRNCEKWHFQIIISLIYSSVYQKPFTTDVLSIHQMPKIWNWSKFMNLSFMETCTLCNWEVCFYRVLGADDLWKVMFAKKKSPIYLIVVLNILLQLSGLWSHQSVQKLKQFEVYELLIHVKLKIAQLWSLPLERLKLKTCEKRCCKTLPPIYRAVFWNVVLQLLSLWSH